MCFLLIIIDSTVLVNASPYKKCDEYNETLITIANNSVNCISQGKNTYSYYGTCGETCCANVMNLLYGTDFTEQDFVDLAYNLKLCAIDTGDLGRNGAQSPKEIVESLTYMGKITGYNVNAKELLTYKKVPDAKKCANILNDNNYIIMKVASSILWNDIPKYETNDAGISIIPNDHWIVIKEPIYGEYGKLVGFDILDSSGEDISYLSIEKLNNCIFGPNKEILYCACVIVSQQDIDSYLRPYVAYSN